MDSRTDSVSAVTKKRFKVRPRVRRLILLLLASLAVALITAFGPVSDFLESKVLSFQPPPHLILVGINPPLEGDSAHRRPVFPYGEVAKMISSLAKYRPRAIEVDFLLDPQSKADIEALSPAVNSANKTQIIFPVEFNRAKVSGLGPDQASSTRRSHPFDKTDNGHDGHVLLSQVMYRTDDNDAVISAKLRIVTTSYGLLPNLALAGIMANAPDSPINLQEKTLVDGSTEVTDGFSTWRNNWDGTFPIPQKADYKVGLDSRQFDEFVQDLNSTKQQTIASLTEELPNSIVILGDEAGNDPQTLPNGETTDGYKILGHFAEQFLKAPLAGRVYRRIPMPSYLLWLVFPAVLSFLSCRYLRVLKTWWILPLLLSILLGGTLVFLHNSIYDHEHLRADLLPPIFLSGCWAPVSAWFARRQVTWVHLSDIHFKEGGNELYDMRLNSLIEDLQKLSEEHDIFPDFFFFTGDAAFGEDDAHPEWGTMDGQFDLAAKYLERVRTAFGPPIPKERSFIIPGNHDVDCSKIDPLDTIWLHSTLLDGRNPNPNGQINQEIRDNTIRWQRIMRRLESYKGFAEKLGYGTIKTDTDEPSALKTLSFRKDRRVRSLDVRIVGLNSTWSYVRESAKPSPGDRQETKKLWACEPGTPGADGVISPDSDLVVTLIHHPSDWIYEEDCNHDLIMRARTTFHLHGHIHQDLLFNSPGYVRIGGRATMTTWGDLGYNVVKCFPDEKRAFVWLRECHQGTKMWTLQGLADRRLHDERFDVRYKKN